MPKVPGAERELLFVDVVGVRNVVPVIDSGETDDSWVLVMPRATMSLREHIQQVGRAFEPNDAIKVLMDILAALVDLDRHGIVHRDLKPENVLLLDDRWCLADFGISRYADATTAPDTKKFALSPPYAAPERWRAERATAATDIYAWGVIAYELLAGCLPFTGPQVEDFREQHLWRTAGSLQNAPVALDAIVAQCIYKPPASRPRAHELFTRIEKMGVQRVKGGGLAKLQEAHRTDVVRHGEVGRRRSEHQSETERRSMLLAHAKGELGRIAAALREAISEAAPSVIRQDTSGSGWSLRLNDAQLEFSAISAVSPDSWGSGWQAPKLDVISSAVIGIRFPPDRYAYEGRSHALWYCDAQTQESYKWFETAFMVSPLVPQRGRQDPFALNVGEESAKAIGSGMTEFQVAWPFTSISVDDLDEFIDRWASWFADASQGKLAHPTSMPERQPSGSWRRI